MNVYEQNLVATIMVICLSKVETKNWNIVVDILNAISDDKALVLFNTIALANGESEIQIRKMGLTTKQYYSRISKLIKANLIRRKNGRYFLTLLGKIVYEAHMTIGKALNYYWKLQALESIQTSSTAASKRRDIQTSRYFDR